MQRLGLILLLLTVTAVPATSQELSNENRQRGHRMLVQLRENLEKYYYDSTYHGVDLDRNAQKTDSAIDAARSLAEMSGALAQFLADLHDSHTTFIPPNLNVSVKYGWRPQTIGDDCYVVFVDSKSDAAKKGLRVGDHILAIDGIRPTRGNLGLISYVYYRLSPRPGMRLLVESLDSAREELTIDAKLERKPTVVDLTDIEEQRFFFEELRLASNHPNHHTRVLGDSVMVWRMHEFDSGKGTGGFDQTVDDVMEQAAHFRHLILDLRGNPGGLVVTLRRLLGHFFADEFVLGEQHTRDSILPMVVRPVGSAPYQGEVTVLIDSESASASELTARTLQLRGRATIVGDRSAGAVMGSIVVGMTLGSDFQARVLPFGMSVTVTDIVMPDGKSLENTGVIPNIAVLPTARDLAQKRDPAMAFALELAGVKMSAEDAGKIFAEDVQGR
jgi:C-terminal processing protease CtpA/Prc